MSAPVSTSTSNLPLLLEIEDLETISSNESIILVDVGSEQRFVSAHIPGASLVTPAMTQAGPPFPGLLPEADQLQQIIHLLGITQNSHLVVYDDEGGGWAGRFIWLLDSIGHHKYSYLNGGLVAWHEAGKPLESGAPAARLNDNPDSLIDAIVDTDVTVTADQLKAAIGQSNTAIWDARHPLEYSGQKVLAAKAGHIPGAQNLEWTLAMDTGNGLRLKPLPVLRQNLEQLGITTEKQLITHCQTHHRSGFTYLVAKILGYPDVKAYAGSWSEWGNLPDTPVEL